MKENIASKQKNTGLRYLYACIMGIISVAICISCAITPSLLNRSEKEEERQIDTSAESEKDDEVIAEVESEEKKEQPVVEEPEQPAEPEKQQEPEKPAENYYAPAPAKEKTSVTYETVVIYDQPVEDSTPVIDERAFDSDDPYEE